MKSLLRYVLPALILWSGVMVNATLSFGKVEYTKKEKKACAVCHVTATSKELNEAGKYYEKHKSLEGYKAEKK